MKKKILIMLVMLAMVFMLIPPQTANAAEKGRIYENENGDLYYIYGSGHEEWNEYSVYIDGKYFDYGGGWKKIDGEYYFFDEQSGYAYREGIYRIYGKSYYFKDCIMQTGWVEWYSGRYYYAGPDGVLIERAGWREIDGKWYYFDTDGEAATVNADPHIEKINGKWYCFAQGGALSSGGWIEENWDSTDENGNIIKCSNWYYANADGTAATGWKYIGGKWYYFWSDYPSMVTGTISVGDKNYLFNQSGSLAGAGWVNLGDDSWGYANAAGEAAPGWKKSGSSWYYIMKNGYASTLSAVVDNTLNFFNEQGVWTGEYKTPGWKSIKQGDNTYWFYVNSDGTAATGWRLLNGKWYYFGELSGTMASGGIYGVGEKIYIFDDNGALISKPGWNHVTNRYGDSYWVYVDSDTSLKTGWQSIGGKWYYLSPTMYSSETYGGYWEIDGEKYYFDENGVMRTGWILVDAYTWTDDDETVHKFETWYHASGSGALDSGWKQIGGKWYYFHKYGNMAYGERRINGIDYIFKDDGEMETGWILTNSYTWTDEDGNAYTNENWSYADASGAIANGVKTINGKRYLFDDYGNCIKDNTFRYNGIQYTTNKDGVITSSFNYQSKYN